MNEIRNDFNPKLKKFFINLQNYLDTELYFYGSVNRSDYVHNKSDIDIAIFTDNMDAMLLKIQNCLNIDRSRIKRFVSKEKSKDKVHSGNKVIYEGDDLDFIFEILIYDSNVKQEKLDFYEKVNNIPIYASLLLLLFK